MLLALAQGAIGGIALQEVHQRFGVITNAGDQLDLVGQFDQVVIGAHREGLAFDLRIFVRRKHDDRCIASRGVGAELANQSQAIDARHHQILENDRRLNLIGDGNGFAGVSAIMEIDIALVGQSAPDGFADHGLIVHQQNHDVVILRMSRPVGIGI